jgi:hypothetical protein
MNRQRERFLLEEEGRRRVWVSPALFLAGAGLLAAIVVVVVWRLGDFGPPPPGLLRPFAVLVLLLLLVLGAGLHTKLRPRHFISVDAAAGTATFVRSGVVERQVPVSEVGPLRHIVEERRVPSGKTHRLATFHVARSEPFQELLLLESEDELKTRRALETRAKAWRVPYVKPSGEVRNPEDLDVPLFQRLGSDEAATTALPQRPDSKLVVAWKEGGYEITTSYRPVFDRKKIAVGLVVPPAVVGWLLRDALRTAFREGPGTPFFWAVAGALILSFVPGLYVAARVWSRLHRPPSIRVSADGVRFRGHSLPLRSIEEIERLRGAACRLVSDDRLVEIDENFCDPSEHEWLHHELRRLVIEAGQRSPQS